MYNIFILIVKILIKFIFPDKSGIKISDKIVVQHQCKVIEINTGSFVFILDNVILCIYFITTVLFKCWFSIKYRYF